MVGRLIGIEIKTAALLDVGWVEVCKDLPSPPAGGQVPFQEGECIVTRDLNLLFEGSKLCDAFRERVHACVEFADLRPFVAGDRLRDVNWRVTARRGDLWVNQRHPDRNADVVLFLDAFDAAALDDAVRAASVLAHRYLQARDRVGLVSFGGTVRWLAAGAGTRQGYRLADALVESQVFENQADKSIDVLPGHVLPPSALVLALSPLVDERVVGALVELRRRGRDVAVIEVEPTRARSGATPGVEGDLAWRLWQLERRSVRDRLLEVGATVVGWPEAPPGEAPTQGAVRERAALEAVGEGLAACRRRSQRVG